MRISMMIAAVVAAGAAMPALAQDFDPMQFADTNTDKKISADEFATFQTGGWQFVSQGADKISAAALDPMVKPMMAGVPVDADGNITQAAYVASIPDRFKAADKDADGSLSEAELRAAIGMPAS